MLFMFITYAAKRCIFTRMAASRINFFAGSVQMAGTVIIQKMLFGSGFLEKVFNLIEVDLTMLGFKSNYICDQIHKCDVLICKLEII